jgi:hypothetical protein
MNTNNIEHLHLIEVKYLSATNTKHARISIYSPRFKQRRYISFDYSYSNILEQSLFWLERNGFKVEAYTEASIDYAILTSTFKPLKIEKQ